MTLLRAAYFQENWGTRLPGVLASGSLSHGLRSDLKFPQVATADIGQHAVRLLLDPVAQGTRLVELAGPEELSLQDTAALISRLSGKPVQVVTVPIEGMIGGMISTGAPAELAALYGELADGINRGIVAWEGGRAVAVRGKTTLEQTLCRLLG